MFFASAAQWVGRHYVYEGSYIAEETSCRNRVLKVAGFTREEQEAIILEFFGAEDASGTPLCPRCGEELRIESSVAGFFGLQLEVRCPGCSERFSWGQPQPERPWKELHLRYFAERHLMGESIICPFDDCLVACAEFQGGVLQFNCPYCNRRGAVELDRE